MGVDWTWAQAGQIGGFGVGLVFVVLIILALAIWLTGLILSKITAGKGEVSNKEKGDQGLGG